MLSEADFREGLRRTIEWYRQTLAQYAIPGPGNDERNGEKLRSQA